MIKVHPDIEINPPDVLQQIVMDQNTKKKHSITYYENPAKKDQRHQKIIVIGDFNAQTKPAKYKSCYDGESLIQDNECNDNGCPLNWFCKSQKMCISSSYFDHPMIDRYTWYSNDKKTKKMNDYVLTTDY